MIENIEVLLDQVDYTKGNCRLNEPVGAVLAKGVIQGARESVATMKANAHLIAAAQDMLAALRLVYRWLLDSPEYAWVNDENGQQVDILEAVEAAIARALGESEGSDG